MALDSTKKMMVKMYLKPIARDPRGISNLEFLSLKDVISDRICPSLTVLVKSRSLRFSMGTISVSCLRNDKDICFEPNEQLMSHPMCYSETMFL